VLKETEEEGRRELESGLMASIR